MSRTFEALRKAEHERKAGRGDGGARSAGAAAKEEGTVLGPPSANRQKAAVELDRSLEEKLRDPSAPVLFVPAVSQRRFAEILLDTAATLALRRGLHCLVVDGNPLSPAMHRYAGVSRSRGVADLLSGRRFEIRGLPVSGTSGTVFFLPAGSGRIPDEEWPERLGAWLEDRSRSFDRVLVAGPPPDEGGTLASLADTTAGTVLVYPHGGGGTALSRPVEGAIRTKILGIVAVS